jgi:hypothetical protein
MQAPLLCANGIQGSHTVEGVVLQCLCIPPVVLLWPQEANHAIEALSVRKVPNLNVLLNYWTRPGSAILLLLDPSM